MTFLQYTPCAILPPHRVAALTSPRLTSDPPRQFQKGIAEGEKEAKAIKANEMKPEKVEDVEIEEE